ncbi:MAG: alpha/beta hydrolase [Planctomycetes bacterium]|nr:alpha/beta hydrolase [Planctomycetota bacterium]
MTQRKPSGAKSRSIDESLLFFPSKFPEGDWTPDGLHFQDVWFHAADKTRLHAWYCPCDHPRAIILIAHGNAGHVASRAPWLQYLQSQARVTTFMFDYRGYGRSEGVPTAAGILDDARAARAKLRELAAIKDSEMLMMGESLGGAVVVHLASESAPRGLILQSTFSSLRDVADVHFPGLSWLVPADKLNSAALIAQYRGPLLQSHGRADDTIPIDSGHRLFRAANEPKEFVEIAGAGHNNWLTPPYLKRLEQFLTRFPPAAK